MKTISAGFPLPYQCTSSGPPGADSRGCSCRRGRSWCGGTCGSSRRCWLRSCSQSPSLSLEKADWSGSRPASWGVLAAQRRTGDPAYSCIIVFILFLDGSRCDRFTSSIPSPVTHLPLTELISQSPQAQNLAYLEPNGSK